MLRLAAVLTLLVSVGLGGSWFFRPHVSVPVESPRVAVETTKPFSVLFVGDTMLGRHVGERVARGIDPFEKIADVLDAHDAVIANLEGPITTAIPCQTKAYSFKFATSTAELLLTHNITGVSLANNHAMDCYAAGLVETRVHLSNAGVSFFGGTAIADSHFIMSFGSSSVAFVGDDRTIGAVPLEDIYHRVESLALEHEMVIVSIHWGEEYMTTPSSAQQKIAHDLVDRGADLVIGHHPHVMQPAEIYRGKAIFYSLGNFVFDQDEGETSLGYGVSMTVYDSTLRYDLVPYHIALAQPEVLSSDDDRLLTCDRILGSNGSSDPCAILLSR